jgi:predicted transcriptional regulator
MKTSLTTFEHRIRDWLLHLLHNQWRALGVPFSVKQPLRPEEAIDPEALFWCSLEFFPTQPRLQEQVLAWWAGNVESLLLPRIRKFAQAQADPRASIWRVLDPQWRRNPKPPSEQCYGQKSVKGLLELCDNLGKKAAGQLRDRRQQEWQRHQQPGKAESTTATAILRARDAIGTDARHSILVYLLANRGGAKLKAVATWSGQSYRNISKTAQRLESANIITAEHGHARLKNPAVWTTLLGLDPPDIVLLNWQRFYDACIKLLRFLSKAQAKSIPADGPVVTGLLREAAEEAAASVETSPSTNSETIRDFRLLLSNLR